MAMVRNDCIPGELSAIFIKFDCCLQTLLVWKNLKFGVWERVKKIKGLKVLRRRLIPFPKRQIFYSSKHE